MHTSCNAFDADCFFNVDVAAFTNCLADITAKVDPNGPPDDDGILQELTVAFHQSRESCRLAEKLIGDDKALLKQEQARFRDATTPWFDQSWFFHRARSKPRGFTGDFEMLDAIYDQEPKSTGIGGYLDRYFLNADLARAVRSRLECIKRFLVKESLNRAMRMSVLNVASGPGREFSSGFEEVSRNVRLTCVDTDQAALDCLRRSVNKEVAADLDLNCVCYSALRMTSPERNIEQFGESDIIYSVGLCDYLSDKYLIRILSSWRRSIAPQGIVYVAFKDCKKYVASEYQWHADWHFYQRTEEDCLKLLEDAGYDVNAMEMFRDDTGIIMNFVARQPATRRFLDQESHVRVDRLQAPGGPHFRGDSDEPVASPSKSEPKAT